MKKSAEGFYATKMLDKLNELHLQVSYLAPLLRFFQGLSNVLSALTFLVLELPCGLPLHCHVACLILQFTEQSRIQNFVKNRRRSFLQN